MQVAPTLMELLTQKNNALNSIASLSKEVPAGKKISPFDQAKKPIDAAFRAAKRQLEADKPQTARKKRESHFPFRKNMGKYTNFAAFVNKDWGTAKDELLAAVRLTPSTGLDKKHDVGGSGCAGSVPRVNAYFGKYSQTGFDIFRLYKISEGGIDKFVVAAHDDNEHENPKLPSAIEYGEVIAVAHSTHSLVSLFPCPRRPGRRGRGRRRRRPGVHRGLRRPALCLCRRDLRVGQEDDGAPEGETGREDPQEARRRRHPEGAGRRPVPGRGKDQRGQGPLHRGQPLKYQIIALNTLESG